MQQHAYVGGCGELGTIPPREIGRAAEALERIGAEVLAFEACHQRRQRRRKGLTGEIGKAPGLAQAVGLRIIGQQSVKAEWPAAVRHVVPSFEIDGIKRHAAAAPDRGGPAKAALPIAIRRAVQAFVGHLAGVQVLGLRLGLKPSRLEQQDVNSNTDQRLCQRDSGGACSHDAKVGIDGQAVRNV